VGSGGDVTVGYLLIVGNNGVTTSIDKYFGYSAAAAALHEKAHDANACQAKEGCEAAWISG
jgi:hypothetical protein